MAMSDNREVTFEITEEIGVLSSYQTGWNKEINMVSWNGNSPKYDIRDWSPDHAQMGRGITLHEKEMRLILDLLRRRPRIRNYRSDSEQEREQEPAFMSAGEGTAGDARGAEEDVREAEEDVREAEEDVFAAEEEGLREATA